MKLKELLVELESSELAVRNREDSGDIFMQEIAAENNGREITIEFEDGYGTAVIYFDERYEVKVNIEIEENEHSVEIDEKKLNDMVLKAVNDKIDNFFDGNTKIPENIDLKTSLPVK